MEVVEEEALKDALVLVETSNHPVGVVGEGVDWLGE